MSCRHLTFDEDRLDDATLTYRRWRECVSCGITYDRTQVLEDLQETIRERFRLPALEFDHHRPAGDHW